VTKTVTYYSKKIITTVKCFYSCVPVRKNIRQKINKNRISKSRTEREREEREKLHETAVRVNISVSALASKYILT
jgi:hypothetical protein